MKRELAEASTTSLTGTNFCEQDTALPTSPHAPKTSEGWESALDKWVGQRNREKVACSGHSAPKQR
jgi:hypothetical protein